MSVLTATQMIQRISDSFNDQDYAGALGMATDGVSHYPDEQPMMAYLRICALVRLDRVEEALKSLATALDSGIWYSEFILRESPSLKPLHGNPKFERLIRISEQKRSEERLQPPSDLMHFPANKPGPFPALVVLHGNNGSVRREREYWEATVGKGWMLGMVESQEGGMMKGNYDWNDDEMTTRRIQEFCSGLLKGRQVDTNRLVLGGFSMGARRAIEHALKGSVGARGFVVAMPYFETLEGWDGLIAQAPAGLCGCLVTGDQDESYTSSLEFARMMQAGGLPCQVEALPGQGHWYPSGFEASLERGLEFLARQPRT
jgi:dienelactone hydrolase